MTLDHSNPWPWKPGTHSSALLTTHSSAMIPRAPTLIRLGGAFATDTTLHEFALLSLDTLGTKLLRFPVADGYLNRRSGGRPFISWTNSI